MSRTDRRTHLGIYAHHGDGGHVARAEAVARAWDGRVTILGSVMPDALGGSGVDLVALPPGEEVESGARTPDLLRHAPLGDAGLRDRMARIAGWIRAGRPDVVLVDDTVEVALLSRLHGVPTALVALPGRDDDGRRLGREVADLVLAPWGEPGDRDDVVHVGLVSRYDDRHRRFGRCGDDTVRVAVVAGVGGVPSDRHLERLRAMLPADHRVDLLGDHPSSRVRDPWSVLVGADVAVAAATTNVVAEVAAAGTPLVVVAEGAPGSEQHVLATVLREQWDVPAADGWDDDLAHLVGAARRAGAQHLSDRRGAARTAEVLAKLAAHGRRQGLVGTA